MMTVSLTLKQAMRIIARKLPELRDDEYDNYDYEDCDDQDDHDCLGERALRASCPPTPSI